MEKLTHLKKTDTELAHLVEKEEKRQQDTLDLIPSENIVSETIREVSGSVLMNKYSEGYPGKRYYAGNSVIDEIELLAQDRARKVFHLGKHWHVNVQALSGSPANMAVYFALLNAGDTIMGMSLPFGGHLTHGWKVNFSGKLYRAVQYEVGRDGFLNYDDIEKLAKKENPKIIVAGATAYPRIIDFEKFAKIARSVGACFMVDMAHIAGLVAAGAHPSPFLHADIVTTTTHKTLRGPRGAIIFADTKSEVAGKKELDIASAIDKAVFPGLQGGPHDQQTAAIAAALKEASSLKFKTYGKQVVKNAKALARALQKHGFELVSGGTDTHLLLIDLTNLGISGKDAQNRLEEVGIIVNRNTIPFDTRSPFDPSGIRIGTPSLTTRGMKEKEMAEVAEFIYIALTSDKGNDISKKVKDLSRRFPV